MVAGNGKIPYNSRSDFGKWIGEGLIYHGKQQNSLEESEEDENRIHHRKLCRRCCEGRCCHAVNR